MTAVTASDTLITQARETLASTFGFSSFRPLQEEVVAELLDGNDVFVLMPTGGGKSLCYQLPAILRDGVTIVVSPLIALMKDQVDALSAAGVPATFINSSLDAGQIRERTGAMVRGEVKLVYVAPERLMMPNFLSALSSVKLGTIAIDEAHCISEWGHDFRPEYRQLSRLRELYPQVPLGAFTATATVRVQADIKRQLGLERAAGFTGSFNRPNLVYEVRPKARTYEGLYAYLLAHRDVSGIIYCGSRAGTEDLAKRLRNDGFKAAAYHAGLDGEERNRRQEAFVRDDIPIIVATVAFGMGIDKPDVRFVIHYDLPKSLEGYYQESGRAGRDGERSDCILFYSPGDIVRQRYFFKEKSDDEREVAEWQLRQMAEWAESNTCRRVALLAYFDEVFEGQEPPCCDVCAAPSTEIDATVPAQMFLSCVKRTGERFGAKHVIDVLRGSRGEAILTRGHDRLSTFGIGRDRSVDDWKAIARALVNGGYLQQTTDRWATLSLGEKAPDILFGAERLTLRVRETPSGTATESRYHADLFDQLRALRKRLADERGVPPYVVFSDVSLRDMAARLPADDLAFRAVTGVGTVKAAEYGPAFLAEIASWRDGTNATPFAGGYTPPASATSRPRMRVSDSMRESLRLFAEGHTLDAISAQRNLARTTVADHLVQAIEAGEDVDVARLIELEKRTAIEAAIEAVGAEKLSPVMEHLGEGYTYDEIKLVRATLRATARPGG
jgi:ATP-dependent DNA helicase RecQ